MENEKIHSCCECIRTKNRTDDEKKQLLNRLSRIEGQVRGIKNMVEKNAYCPDILMQVSAATAALNAFNRELLSAHIKTCVADGIRQGSDEKIDELVAMLSKLMK
ncbi:MAG: metal-sensing transcriptional repressor [Acutalibacteraceae bacterium]